LLKQKDSCIILQKSFNDLILGFWFFRFKLWRLFS